MSDAWDGMFPLLGAEEAYWAGLQEEARDELNRRLKALRTDVLGEQVRRLEEQAGWVETLGVRFVHARLCRMLPHMSDVLSLACFPDDVTMPGVLMPDGKPEPRMVPREAFRARVREATR